MLPRSLRSGPLAVAFASMFACAATVVTAIPNEAVSWRTPTWPPAQVASADAPVDRGETTFWLDGPGGPLPRLSTEVQARLHGPVAEVLIRQRFRNDRPSAIQPVVRATRSAGGVLLDLRARLEERPAQFSGVLSCGALEWSEQRPRPAEPGLAREFVHELPPVPAGAVVVVELRLLERLEVVDGEIEFSTPIDGPALVDVVAEATAPILAATSPTPGATLKRETDRLIARVLVDEGRLGERFILRYRVGDPWPAGALLVMPRGDGGAGEFALVLGPPGAARQPEARELVFLVDAWNHNMGSFVVELLKSLGPDDTFQVLRASGRGHALFEASQPVTLTSARMAYTELWTSRSLGVEVDVAEWLARAPIPGRRRHLLILDGTPQGPDRARLQPRIDLLRDVDPRSRAFFLNFGVSRTTWSMRALAAAGGTEPISVFGTVVEATERVRRYFEPFAVHDMKVVAAGLEIESGSEVPGSRRAGAPTVVLGRYRGDPGSVATLRALVGDRAVDLKVPIFRLDDRLGGLRSEDPCVHVADATQEGGVHGWISCNHCGYDWGYRRRSESRDPTRAVADLTPLAGDDARGPRIGGMPSAESEVRVDGVPIAAGIAYQTPEESIPTRQPPVRVPFPSARVEVRTPRVSGPLRPDIVRRVLTARTKVLAECFTLAGRETYRVRRQVVVRIRRAAGGAVVEASALGRRALDLQIGACLRDVVAESLPGTEALTVEVPLIATMRY